MVSGAYFNIKLNLLLKLSRTPFELCRLVSFLLIVSSRDRRCRTFRFLVPNQASHPATISRLFVGLRGFEPLRKESKSLMLPLHHKPSIAEEVRLELTRVLPPTVFKTATRRPTWLTLPLILSNTSMNSLFLIML